MSKKLTGGQILVDALRRQSVDRVFCVPGESYLQVLDALHDASEIAVVSARHEGAAANMAEADGKLTGRPGICMVTRGPGATHACVGVHTAFQDSTPMILFIGQVARSARDREGFQEVDFRAMFAPLAKWAAEIDDAARIPEYVARAYRVAMSGRKGPVVLSLPEDMLSDEVDEPAQPARIEAAGNAPRPADLAMLARLLAEAERPLLIVGGSGWTDEACQAVARFARRHALPLVASFRRQDLIDNDDENYCGHLGLGVDPSLAARVKSADLLVSLGSRLGENTSGGYTLLEPTVPLQRLVHVHPNPEEPGRVYQPELAIACGLSDFGLALEGLEFPGRERRREWLMQAREAYLKFRTPLPPPPAGVDLAATIAWLSANLAEDAVIANGAGNYTVWLHRFFRYRRPRTELASTSGAMGYGLPAAIAAKMRHPDRAVVAFAGDGCFLMYPQELGTAVQYGAAVIVIIVNNGMYGTIRTHQERRYPGRVIATDIRSPDFLALGRSLGAFAERVVRTEDFPAAFERASRCGVPSLIELVTDPAQLSPTLRLS